MRLWARGHLCFSPASCYYVNSSGAATGKQVSLLPLSLAQVSAQLLGRCSFSSAEGTSSYTIQRQTAARGGRRRAPACGTPSPAAGALTPATEYVGRKEKATLLFSLLEMQEEHRERYKSCTKVKLMLQQDPQQLEFPGVQGNWSSSGNCSPLPRSTYPSLKKEGFEGQK